MDKAKILRLCNEIEKEISEAWNCDVIEYDKAGHIITIAQKIAAEITAPPKTNADKVRSMTDEELSAFLGWIADNCSYNTCDNCPMYGACVDVPLSRDKWLKQEVDPNDGWRQDQKNDGRGACGNGKYTNCRAVCPEVVR